MPLETYHQALRLGQKDAKLYQSQGKDPYLQVMPEECERCTRREFLGVVDIPAHAIVGTQSENRRLSFSPSFYPLIETRSEFSTKWVDLCDAHLSEGIRDPIKAVEYMHRYYVVEGHKRVSVLKFFGAVSIPGVVTRLIPDPSDDPEVVAYYEFLQFYRLTGINYLPFRRPGEYAELCKLLDYPDNASWSAEQIYTFRSFFYTFQDAFLGKGGNPDAVPEGLLVFLHIFGYQDSIHKLPADISRELESIRAEIENRLDQAGVILLLDTEAKRPLIHMSSPGPVCAAFLHGGDARVSGWVHAHEMGRRAMELSMGGQVRTLVYEDLVGDAAVTQAMEDAIAQGADVIFTTTPAMIAASVKAAVAHPEVKILNCSLNIAHPSIRTYYPRMYEAEFLKGALAGTLAPGGKVGYVADYTTYGTIASINAFARGVQMVNTRATVYLEWSQLAQGGHMERLEAAGVSYIDNLSMLTNDEYGILASDRLVAPDYAPHNRAITLCRWGEVYKKLMSRILDGRWKSDVHGSSATNYWWGMNQGVVDVICSRTLPDSTLQLMELLREALGSYRLLPFSGTLRRQDGQVVHRGRDSLSAEEILTMNWLASNVEGRLPEMDELTPKAQALVRLQGVNREETP